MLVGNLRDVGFIKEWRVAVQLVYYCSSHASFEQMPWHKLRNTLIWHSRALSTTFRYYNAGRGHSSGKFRGHKHYLVQQLKKTNAHFIANLSHYVFMLLSFKHRRWFELVLRICVYRSDDKFVSPSHRQVFALVVVLSSATTDIATTPTSVRRSTFFAAMRIASEFKS